MRVTTQHQRNPQQKAGSEVDQFISEFIHEKVEIKAKNPKKRVVILDKDYMATIRLFKEDLQEDMGWVDISNLPNEVTEKEFFNSKKI